MLIRLVIFTARRYASTVCAVVIVCPSICLSVTSLLEFYKDG